MFAVHRPFGYQRAESSSAANGKPDVLALAECDGMGQLIEGQPKAVALMNGNAGGKDFDSIGSAIGAVSAGLANRAAASMGTRSR